MRKILISLITFGCAFSMSAQSNQTSSNVENRNTRAVTDKPNYILIVADDLGFADLSFNGSTQINTPNIDRLANTGVKFSEGYVSSPVCSPSRAGLMTGINQVKFGHDNNIGGNQPGFDSQYLGLPLSQKTIASRLKPMGYVSGLVGKWHLGDETQFHPLKRGFNEFWGYTGGGHDYFKTLPDGKGYQSPIECNYKTPSPISYITDDNGQKGILLEGGIHVPFVMNWPNIIPEGITYSKPVSSLDIMPTMLELAGRESQIGDKFDGVNLIPYILEEKTTLPHQELKWRFTISAAIRDGDWKLLRLPDRFPLLYHLPSDTSEQNNIALKNIEKTEELLQKLGNWDVSLPHPVFLEGAVWKRRQLDLYDKKYQLIQPVQY